MYKNVNSKSIARTDDNPTCFRLISLYIGSFEPFKGQTMNFCSDYRTKVKNSKGRLRLEVTHEKVLPDNFFALNEGNGGNGCVKSVSAVIGINGSGKTTLARLLCNLPSSDPRKPEWRTVLIYEDQGNVAAYSTFPQVTIELISATGKKRSIKPISDLVAFFPYRLFYYSPYFTTEQFIVSATGYHVNYGTRDEGDYVKNISTTWLLLHPDGNSELLSRVGARQSSIFDADEKIRLFEFIAEYKENRKELSGKFDMPMPESISIGVHHEGFHLALKEMKDNAERVHIINDKEYRERGLLLAGQKDSVGDYLHEVLEVFYKFDETARRHSFVVNVFMSYAAQYIQGSGIFNASFPLEALQEGFLADLKVFIVQGSWLEEEKIKSFFKEHRPDLPIRQEEKVSDLRDNHMVELIELLQKFCRDSKASSNSRSPTVILDGNILNCRFDKQEVLEDVCRLVRLHAGTRGVSPYLKFDVYPNMSSGEMSFLTLFSRLYRFVGKVPEGENIVVFLDEAETTLHPEWQRRLVAYCVRFFEVFLPNRNYQLIFSSHSPMLLTDIPRGNVAFLNEKCHSVDIRRQKTFAANTFELYKDSFVLKKGQMGEFAATKVDQLLRKLKSEIKAYISDEDLKVAGLIDDPFISQYVWNRLGHMVVVDDIPEDEMSDMTTEA